MAEIGSIRGGDGSIPGEEIKKEPQFLQPSTRLAILSAMAPTRSEAEIGDLRRLVLAAEPTKTYTIPSQVEPKYTCDVCGNRNQTKFLHESKDGDVVCLGIGDQGCGNVVEEHKLFEGNQFRKFEGEEDKSHPVWQAKFNLCFNFGFVGVWVRCSSPYWVEGISRRSCPSLGRKQNLTHWLISTQVAPRAGPQ